MSCNGCRVLRKGCSDSCILRSSLQWIDSPESQGHATVFVAKFFGRAGMLSFINAVSESQRPALFQSLLYEACGRTVNPVFGAVGLLWSGNWSVCQSAVETVLKGGTLKPTTQCLPSSINPTSKPPPMAPFIYNTTNQGVSSPSKPSIIHPESESMAQIEAHNNKTLATASTTATSANATTTTTTPLGAASCETPPSHPTLPMKRPYMLPITSTTTTTTTTNPISPPKRPKSCPSRPHAVDPSSANGSPTIRHTFEQREICSPPEQEEERPHPPHHPTGGQLIAPIPRRVRVAMPMIKHHEMVSSNCMPVSSSCETPLSYGEDMEVSTMHLVESMTKENVQEGRVELNLSLNNFHGVMMRSKVYTHGGSSPPHDDGQNRVSSPLTGINRVSSPCSFSVNSEGSSLTSLDSVEFSMSSCWHSQQQEGLHHHVEERQLLNLL